MTTLQIKILNPKAGGLLRELQSLELIAIIPKQQNKNEDAPSNIKPTTAEKWKELCSQMDVFQHSKGFIDDSLTMEEIVDDCKQARAEIYAERKHR
jgi:hypothetical protein